MNEDVLEVQAVRVDVGSYGELLAAEQLDARVVGDLEVIRAAVELGGLAVHAGRVTHVAIGGCVIVVVACIEPVAFKRPVPHECLGVSGLGYQTAASNGQNQTYESSTHDRSPCAVLVGDQLNERSTRGPSHLLPVCRVSPGRDPQGLTTWMASM